MSSSPTHGRRSTITAAHEHRGSASGTHCFVVVETSGQQSEPLYHAKMFGTLRTVCGESSSTWARLWTMPFLSTPGPKCARCLDIVVPA